MHPSNEVTSRLKISVATKIFFGFIVVVCAFSSSSLYTIYRMNEFSASVTIVWEEIQPIQRRLDRLSDKLRGVEQLVADNRPGNTSFLQKLLPPLRPFEELRKIESSIQEAMENPAVAPIDKSALERVHESLGKFRSGSDLVEALSKFDFVDLDVILSSKTSEDIYAWLVRKLVKQISERPLEKTTGEYRAMSTALRSLFRVVFDASQQMQQPVENLGSRVIEDERLAWLAVLITTFVALFLSLLMMMVSHFSLSPIKRLRTVVQQIAEGDYDERTGLKSRDEIGDLAREFDRMADALQERNALLAKQREELLRVDRLATIGKFAAQITHEVRNPLLSIGLNAELLEDEFDIVSEDRPNDHGDPSEALLLLRSIQDEVTRLKGITNEYLRYARMPIFDFSNMDIGELLSSIYLFLGPTLDEMNISTTVEICEPHEDGSGLSIIGDNDQLRQVVLNVIRNAIEALKDIETERRLRIELKEVKPAGYEISITDNGPGVDPGLADQIFEPFVTGKGGGTGLGLSLAHQIIVAHRGEISVTSPFEGDCGTRFSIILPAKQGSNIDEQI